MIHRVLTIVGLVLLLAGCGAANVPSGESPGTSQTAQGATAQPTDPTYPAETTADTTTGYPMEAPTSEVTAYPGPTKGEQATASTSADGANDIIAVWRRAGGFAGFQDSITVHADGRMEIDRNGSLTTEQLAPDELARLRSTLDSAEWNALGNEYGKPFPDAFAYSIEANGKSVRTYDATEIPPILTTAMAQFSGFYADK